MTDKEKNIILENNERVDKHTSQLLKAVNDYMDEQTIEPIKLAIDYAKEAHQTQKRANGEPYILHPLSVANILAEDKLSPTLIITAILHDTVEDTSTTLEDLEKLFGSTIASLVGHVTKIDKLQFSSSEERQVANFRKLIISIAKNPGVIIIKLADRLHNMRTLKFLPEHKRKRIAKETLNIYAPLAYHFGIYKWKWELEDLCLRYLDTKAYDELVGMISVKRKQREQLIEDVIADLHIKLEDAGIKCEVEGRAKHFYSIYKKMKKYDTNSISGIYDLFACRVLVDDVGECYKALGVVHEFYKPNLSRFKDYIAVPKSNNYQSIHTTLTANTGTLKGTSFEVQIRTYGMHEDAELGVASHWRYKQGAKYNYEADNLDIIGTKKWFSHMQEWKNEVDSAEEFWDTLQRSLVQDEIYVFTPKGQIVNLPADSSPIDFAYFIHSGIGNKMHGAKVNGRMVPLTYKLQSGDKVEILTSDNVRGPSRDWLKLVVTSSAKSKINQFFKKSMRPENIIKGRELLEREARRESFEPADILKPAFIKSSLQQLNFNKLEDLYASLGYGSNTVGKIFPKIKMEYIKSLPPEERLQLGYRINSSGQLVYNPQVVEQVENMIQPTEAGKKLLHSNTTKKSKNEFGIIVHGIDNCLVRLSHCCNPIVGDPIIGYISRGKGVAVHRQDCINIKKIIESSDSSPEDAERTSRLIETYWDESTSQQNFLVVIKILAHDRNQLLIDLSQAIADEHAAIINGKIGSVKNIHANFEFTLEVHSHSQLNRTIGRLKAVPDVISVQRA